MTTNEIETAAAAAGIAMNDLLAGAGITRQVWWRWQAGKTEPRAATMAKLCAALRARMDQDGARQALAQSIARQAIQAAPGASEAQQARILRAAQALAELAIAKR